MCVWMVLVALACVTDEDFLRLEYIFHEGEMIAYAEFKVFRGRKSAGKQTYPRFNIC